MTVTPINSLDEFKTIINSGNVIVIDFWATWCGPCRVISPSYVKMSEVSREVETEFYKVDVDEQPEIAQEVGIRMMPTFLVYKDGAKIDELTGAKPDALMSMVTKHAPVRTESTESTEPTE